MIATLSKRPEELLRFHAHPWPFQQTIQTPLKDLNRFVSTFLALFSLESGFLSTDQVVFEPEHLLQLATKEAVVIENCYEFNIGVEGQREIAELLEAALGDWVDFAFLPNPESFAIYADHDEFTTFYARSQSDLEKLVSELTRAGFDAVLGYERPEGFR